MSASNAGWFSRIRRKDKGDIQRLAKALGKRGIGVWENVLELRLGDSLDALKAAVIQAYGFVLLLTPEAISSDWVQREIDWAREAKLARLDYALLPLLRGLGRPVLKPFFKEVLRVSVVLGDKEAIESAMMAIVSAERYITSPAPASGSGSGGGGGFHRVGGAGEAEQALHLLEYAGGAVHRAEPQTMSYRAGGSSRCHKIG